MRYRVDNIPWIVRPVYLVVTWGIGILLFLYYRLCHLTSRIVIEGPGDHDLSHHAIFCLWHQDWWPWFVVFTKLPSPHAMINHPAAYMKPVHVVLRWMGVKHLVLGSSGDEGKRAAQRLADLVRQGFPTTISPDGPSGPPRVLKKGVLHVALRSGVPIVPLIIKQSRFVPIRSWDSKRLPLPFNRITVTVGEPIAVTEENFSEATARITKALAR